MAQKALPGLSWSEFIRGGIPINDPNEKGYMAMDMGEGTAFRIGDKNIYAYQPYGPGSPHTLYSEPLNNRSTQDAARQDAAQLYRAQVQEDINSRNWLQQPTILFDQNKPMAPISLDPRNTHTRSIPESKPTDLYFTEYLDTDLPLDLMTVSSRTSPEWAGSPSSPQVVADQLNRPGIRSITSTNADLAPVALSSNNQAMYGKNAVTSAPLDAPPPAALTPGYEVGIDDITAYDFDLGHTPQTTAPTDTYLNSREYLSTGWPAKWGGRSNYDPYDVPGRLTYSSQPSGSMPGYTPPEALLPGKPDKSIADVFTDFFTSAPEKISVTDPSNLHAQPNRSYISTDPADIMGGVMNKGPYGTAGTMINSDLNTSAKVGAGIMGLGSLLAGPGTLLLGPLGSLANSMGAYQDLGNPTFDPDSLSITGQGFMSGKTSEFDEEYPGGVFYQSGPLNNYNSLSTAPVGIERGGTAPVGTYLQYGPKDAPFRAEAKDFIGDLTYSELQNEISRNPEEYSTVVGGTGDGGGDGGDGGDCFLTTAACEVMGKPDNCVELETFRKVRDKLYNHPIAKWLIRKYYREAPLGADLLRSHPNRDEIAKTMFTKYIPKVMKALEKGSTWRAIFLYWAMSRFVKRSVL